MLHVLQDQTELTQGGTGGAADINPDCQQSSARWPAALATVSVRTCDRCRL